MIEKFISVLIIIIFVNSASAQQYSCVSYDPSRLLSPCSVYNPSSWAYIDLTSQSVDDLINSTNILIQGTLAFPSTPACAPWIATWLCQNTFLSTSAQPLLNCPVDNLLQPPPTAVRVPTCLDMCREFFINCKPSFDSFGPGIGSLLPPNYCDAFSNDPIVQNGVIYPCWNITPVLNPTPENRTCPKYTELTETHTCSPACPSPEYSHEDVKSLGLMQQIVGWISFVVSFVFAIIFVCEPTFRRFPSSVIIFLLIGSMVLALAFMLATFVGGDVGDVWCGDVDYYAVSKLNTNDRDIHHGGLCTFQGWNIVLGTLLIAHWWVALSLNCAIVIRHGLNYSVFNFSNQIKLIYHALCWGLPLTYSIIAVAATKINYEASNAFCFISSADNNAWQIALWFVPMGLCLVLGSCFSLYAIFMLHFSQMRLKDHRHYGPTLRIIFCALYFIIVITIIFASQIFTSANQSGVSVELIVYLVCIIGKGDESECRHTFESNSVITDQYGLAAAATFFMASSGIFFVTFFATHRRIVALLTGSTPSESAYGSSARGSRSEPRDQL